MCPIVEPDFSERPPLSPGQYRATIKKCEVKTAKGSGNPYLSWVFETDVDRQWVYLNTTYSGKGAQMFRNVIRASLAPTYESGPVDTDQCIGKSVLIQVDYDRSPNASKWPIVLDVKADEETFDAYEGP